MEKIRPGGAAFFFNTTSTIKDYKKLKGSETMRTQATQEHNDKVRKELEEYINEVGTTNKFVAAKVNLSNSTIGKFRKGTINLSIENLNTIAAYLNNAKAR